jgi:hypothetical protein
VCDERAMARMARMALGKGCEVTAWMHLPSQSVTSPGWAHASCPCPDRIVRYRHEDQRIEAPRPPILICNITIAAARLRSPHALGAGGAQAAGSFLLDPQTLNPGHASRAPSVCMGRRPIRDEIRLARIGQKPACWNESNPRHR